jgi:hypothetical protein
MLRAVTATRHAEPIRPVIVELVFAAVRVGAIGLVAIGVSGVIAWGMGTVAGKAFVAGDPPGVTYSAARCRDFLEYVPHASSCVQAATTHHFGEVVWDRIAVGIFGGLVIATEAWARRRRQHRELQPETFIPTVAAAVFGLAGLWLIGQGIDAAVLKLDGGAGEYLSGGVVSLAVGMWFAIPVIRALAV